jgi:hypothetical protein
MTAEAQRLLVLDQQVWLIGGVRRVAGRASIGLQDLVDDFLRVVRLVMALVADLARFDVQQMARVRRVRTVAQHALATLHRRVDVGLVQAHLVFRVTGVTELVAFAFHGGLGHEPVTQMALFALLLLDDGMNVLHAHVLVGEGLVAGEAIAVAEALLGIRRRPAQDAFRLRLSVRDLEARAEDQQRDADQAAECPSWCRHYRALAR